jgi:hypothetical protein
MTYLMPDTGMVLEELRDRVRVPTRRLDTHSGEISVSPTTLRLGEVEVPTTSHNLVQLASFYKVPESFLARHHDSDWAPTILNEVVRRQPERVSVYYTDYEPALPDPETGETSGGPTIVDVLKPTMLRFTPLNLVDTALGVMPADSLVTDLLHDGKDFMFSARVTEEYEQIGGDPQVGDITAGGLMFHLPIRKRLAPSVATYLHRLVCTNGMVVTDRGFRVDARGETVDEVLASLELKAELAFSAVERNIEHFYALRQEEVANPERTLLRLFDEFDVPTRLRDGILHRAPEIEAPATMFDLMNLITNQANHDEVAFNPGQRHRLQSVGGSIIVDRASRCSHCQHRVG